MNKKAVIKALLISILFGINSSYALFSSDLQENKQIIQDNLKGYSLFVPSGTTCNAILATDINSSNAILGQSINAVLVEDFKYQDTIIASKGSIIKGMISINKRKYQNNSNELQVKFTTILTPYNNVIPINANIVAADLTGILKPEDENKDIIIESNSPINIIFNQPITLGVQ